MSNKSVACLFAVCTSIAIAAIDPVKDVWFLADFDSPARMNGEAFFQELSPAGYCDGKFGKGFYFYRETNNKLLPMAQFFANKANFIGEGIEIKGESLTFKGGEFSTAEHETGIGYHWVGHDAGNTWSFYVKGAKGITVTAYPELSPLTDAILKEVAKNKAWGYAEANAEKDVVVTNTVELTGGWQRVSCYVKTDNRTGGKRKVSLKIKTSGPVEIEKFQLQVTGVYPFKGRFDAGMWIDGGRSDRGSPIACSDPVQMSSFPYEAGTCAFWVKNPDAVPTATGLHIWSFTKAWGSDWGLDNGFFKAGNGGSMLHLKKALPRTNEWAHVAVVWNKDRFAYYVNGNLINELVRDEAKKTNINIVPMVNNAGTFRVGAFGDGSGPTDAVLDDFAIFNRVLTDDEIQSLVTAKNGLCEGSKEVLAENILFRTFFRDQDDARLRFRVSAPAAATYKLTSNVGGIDGEAKNVSLPEGVSYFEVSFNPALFRPGKYPFSFELTDANGVVALSRKGEVKIMGRLGKDPYIFHSWGGMGYIHQEFMKVLGVNAYNIGNGSKLEIRKALDAGFFANIRYENGNAWFKTDFDWEKIRDQTVKDLEFAAALPNWRTTLLNSEIYGSGTAKRAQENPKYLAMVEKETGLKPDFTFGDAPSEVSWSKLGIPPARGEIDHKTYPTLETLNYVTGKGLPSILSNYETTKAIKSVKPDVMVWSEPMWGALTDSVDMGADWEYEYSTATTLRQLRAHYSACRRFGKPYMPTLAGNYWPEQKGRHPTRVTKEGKPEVVDMGQGADEVTIKTWMSIGAIPAHNLSWFGLNSWEYGVSNALKYVASPTNAVPSIAEPDCAQRYGARWYADIAPAAELLRDMPNVRAKIAYLSLPEIPNAAGFWWGIAHYPNTILGNMSKCAASFDFIGRSELLAGDAEKYEYIVYPMSRVVYKEHADALRKAAKAGVKIVLDSYATNRYENCVYLKDLSYMPGQWGKMADAFNAWYTNVAPQVAKSEPASSDCDGKSSFTFSKEYKGARYVVVVNDLRDQNPSFLNQFKTNDWYRVVGAPQTIKTVIRNVAKNDTVYLFNARSRLMSVKPTASNTLLVTADYTAAEGRVYCIYPNALKAPKLELEGIAAPGKVADLVVRISDKSGAAAPGRQIVDLKLTDSDGNVRDESGRYTVEDGIVRIPVRFALDEHETGFMSKWKAEVTDLTTGLDAALKFGLKR